MRLKSKQREREKKYTCNYNIIQINASFYVIFFFSKHKNIWTNDKKKYLYLLSGYNWVSMKRKTLLVT